MAPKNKRSNARLQTVKSYGIRTRHLNKKIPSTKYILLFERLPQAGILDLKKGKRTSQLKFCKINNFEQSTRYAHTVLKICPIVKVIKKVIYILRES